MPLYMRVYDQYLSSKASSLSWPSMTKWVDPADMEVTGEDDRSMTVDGIRKKYGPLSEGEPRECMDRCGEKVAVPLLTEIPMETLSKELRIRGESYVAIGTDPDYLPVYRRTAMGYNFADMHWWSLTRFIPMSEIEEGETKETDAAAILASYGRLWEDRPQPVSLDAALDRVLPLIGRDGKPKV